ncbi:DUF948 domain-containing protein [Brevibacillus centrosporus]|uniref:Uncharacterized protein YoxC, contains an MCP-like domain n=1 Tax=Brevibacillus centrosporus TaxID=54910 RepID=A0A1I3XHB1_9BACL|nr:DUF948 domain-containing protein [Brevibacillus centrosporus]MEC2133250.1 DUF948 domain-containing protein [Brevibacillus centrosporus]MED4911002.1 DUF948 domain-containing protein [Brevibacillus centrosporus]RNB64989.1 DUF948 domain-containing protein [Brevibacillus centrosporus]SFK18933.1 Uncharacterized protein YoxC, contains an MCP-like domain [Brevibacillus centrosporus]GED34421.1 hypothetical protein BCE02nite_55620 [Brevibacillus centrosporus]
MLLEISALLIAVAFVILTFYLIRTLQAVKNSLDEVTNTLVQMKIEVREIGDEVKEVVEKANEMAVDLRTKLTMLDHLFSSANDVGQIVHELTSSIKESATSLIASMTSFKNSKKIAQPPGRWHSVFEGVIAAVDLWQKVKSSRSNAPGTR